MQRVTGGPFKALRRRAGSGGADGVGTPSRKVVVPRWTVLVGACTAYAGGLLTCLLTMYAAPGRTAEMLTAAGAAVVVALVLGTVAGRRARDTHGTRHPPATAPRRGTVPEQCATEHRNVQDDVRTAPDRQPAPERRTVPQQRTAADQETLREQHAVRLALVDERLRFASDLHDLLGYSLVALPYKAEVAGRLIGRDDERARAEMGQVAELARQAARDVRTVAQRYRDLRFSDELASARETLRAARVDVVVYGDVGPLDRGTSTLLATVLREGVTNVLRHSDATRCCIRVRRRRGLVQLVLLNDGAPMAGAATPAGGAVARGIGLESLTARLARVCGRLTAAVDREGWFRLDVVCPVPDGTSADGGPTGEAGGSDGRIGGETVRGITWSRAASPPHGRFVQRPVDCGR